MPKLGRVDFDFKQFGRAVAKARFERGITQIELAAECEVRTSVISALERYGARTIHANLQALCTALNLKYEEFET